jgi:formylglycine-generating enzyme required for sulfatase activity/streptogramin lyase
MRPFPLGPASVLAGSLAVAIVAAASCRRLETAPAVQLFPTTTRGCGLSDIAVAPDGEIWFTEANAGRIGRISGRSPHRLEELPIEPANGRPGPIAVTADGTVWAADVRGVRLIGLDRRDPAAPRVVGLLTTSAVPRALAARADGALVVSQGSLGLLTSVETSPPGRIHEFRLPEHASSAGALAVTPGGAVWFALDTVDQIGFLDPRKAPPIEVRSLRAAKNGLSGAVAGPDGNVWFTCGGANRVARVTPGFVVTEWPLPTAGAFPRDPVAGSDGAIWFLEAKARKIGRIEVTPPYRVAEFDLPGVDREPKGLAAGADGALWFMVPGADSVARFAVPRSIPTGGPVVRAAGGPKRPATYPAPAAPVPTAGLHLMVDEACALSVDGTDVAHLRDRESRVLVLPVGRHVITVTADRGGARTRLVELWSGVGAMMVAEFDSAYAATDGSVPRMPALRFADVPAGEFVMGAGGAWVDEVPPHRVRISRPFEMGTTEVTQGQWLWVMGRNPTDFENRSDDRPMQKVSWDDAQAFLERLGALDPAHAYRLPTEAEWEYAARAGDPEPCPAIDSTMGWFGAELFDQVHPVATKRPNAWGLYDLVGNAGEWCGDWYDPDTYRHDAFAQRLTVDPVGPDRGYERVYRGFRSSPGKSACWVTARRHFPTTTRVVLIGFRVVREPR